MTITRRMDRQGLVTTEVFGFVSMRDILNAVIELGELTAWSNQLWEIVVLDKDIRTERRAHITLETAHSAKEIIQFKSQGAIAIVTPDERTGKWGEQIADMLRGDAVPVTVFEDEAQARKWLSIHMENAALEATTVRRNRPLNVDSTAFRQVQQG